MTYLSAFSTQYELEGVSDTDKIDPIKCAPACQNTQMKRRVIFKLFNIYF